MALIVAVVLLSGCAGNDEGGEGVATAGDGKAAASSSPNAAEGDRSEQLRKFATCMRENGIDMPDPETDGEGRVMFRAPEGAKDGAPPDRETFEAAQQKCKQYLPNGGEPPRLDAEAIDKMREYAKCMRENGVPEFPDPQPDGGMRIEASPGSGLDPGGQVWKDAQAKCEQYMPRRPGGPGPTTNSNGGGS
jgi:hypothetical protein